MDVSIIIVNYNTISFLIDAIDSVLAKTEGIEYEIIVVDNNSSDNSKNILAEKYGDKVIYLALPENIGFGRANNEGAKIAKGRNLFLLNPDTILLNNAIKILSDYLDDNPNVGCCGGNLFDADGNPTFSYRKYFYSVFFEISRLFFLLPEKLLYGRNVFFNNTNRPLKVAFITGADLMIRKVIFDELCGFDPDFFMYSEESELEFRVAKSGYKRVSIPSAKIIHFEGKSFSNNFDRNRKLLASRNILIKKMYKPLTIAGINVLFLLNTLVRLFIFTLLQNKEKTLIYSEIYKDYKLYN